MKKIKGAILVLSLLIFQNVQAQKVHRCGSQSYHLNKTRTDVKYRARVQQSAQLMKADNPLDTVTTLFIPVVVHVLYHTDAQNISSTQIFSQFSVLNEDYNRVNADAYKTPSVWQSVAANARIKFGLAQKDENGNPTTGIVRNYTAKTSFSMEDDDAKMPAFGGDTAWDRTQYLNIWVVPEITSTSGSGVLGYATGPFSDPAFDGVVIVYNAFGRNSANLLSKYNKGRTATHEIGHWLDLYHIWGDDGGACDGSDEVDDTPNQADASDGIPSFPLKDACSPDSPGVMYMNYMDYSDDAAMNMFTRGQANRMRTCIYGPRINILTNKAAGGITGISVKETPSSEFNFYPNPVCCNLNISGRMAENEKMEVAVYGILGNLITEEIFIYNQNNIYNLDLSHFSNGLYIVQVKVGNNYSNRKITVLKK